MQQHTAVRKQLYRHDVFFFRDALAAHLLATYGTAATGPAKAVILYVQKIRCLTELVHRRCKFNHVPSNLLEDLVTAKTLGADTLEIDHLCKAVRLVYEWAAVQLGLTVSVSERETEAPRTDLKFSVFDMRFTGISSLVLPRDLTSSSLALPPAPERAQRA